ncbi:hypothetical protein [Methyloceanibacter superfactus]|nr:hypothetical protein [Methyloceanibacter superfactus]
MLHEGPVPLTETLEDLTAGRIEYLAAPAAVRSGPSSSSSRRAIGGLP